MTRLQLIFAGTGAGAAGAIALSLAFAPPPSTSAVAPAVAPAPAPVTVAATPAPVRPAPVVARATVTPVAAKAQAPSAGMAGMVVAIDPESGELGMPSAEQLAELHLTESDQVSRDQGGVVVRNADGSLTLDLQGRGQDYAVVRRTADGKLVVGCTDHPEDADHLHLTPAGLEEK